jgi:hypothetical protein
VRLSNKARRAIYVLSRVGEIARVPNLQLLPSFPQNRLSRPGVNISCICPLWYICYWPNADAASTPWSERASKKDGNNVRLYYLFSLGVGCYSLADQPIYLSIRPPAVRGNDLSSNISLIYTPYVAPLHTACVTQFAGQPVLWLLKQRRERLLRPRLAHRSPH